MHSSHLRAQQFHAIVNSIILSNPAVNKAFLVKNCYDTLNDGGVTSILEIVYGKVLHH